MSAVNPAELTSNYKLDSGLSTDALMKGYGIDEDTAWVISDLAVARVAARLTLEEVFILGTSRAAMRLFETGCTEGIAVRPRRTDPRLDNVVTFPRPIKSDS